MELKKNHTVQFSVGSQSIISSVYFVLCFHFCLFLSNLSVYLIFSFTRLKTSDVIWHLRQFWHIYCFCCPNLNK